jgi:hypothetical protein
VLNDGLRTKKLNSFTNISILEDFTLALLLELVERTNKLQFHSNFCSFPPAFPLTLPHWEMLENGCFGCLCITIRFSIFRKKKVT